MRVSVSACLIVKNEEAYLDTCLSKLHGFADELVIVDTGSEDQTREIARAHGATLLETPWSEDFATARNLGLAHASGDWILYIDADEHFDTAGHDKSCLLAPSAIAGNVSLQASLRLTPYPEPRLFRNRPDIRFQSVIHETVHPHLHDILARDRTARIIETPYRIEHFGYEGDLTHKHLRNANMLEQAVRNNPQRIYLWHALGECLVGLGDRAAAANAWHTGLTLVRGRPSRTEDALIYADLLSLHFDPAGPTLPDGDTLLAEARARHAEDPLILWYSARKHLAEENLAAARSECNTLLSMTPQDLLRAPLGYDKRLFRQFPWALLGSCALAENAHGEAVHCYERALADEPDNQELLTKLQLARLRASA